MIRKWVLVASIALPAASVHASPNAAAADAIGDRVAAAVAAKASRSVRVSVGVWDAATGAVLHRTEADASRRPASVMKLATTAAALLRLGPKLELATEALASVRPEASGRLAGDLVVRGGGDVGFNNRDRGRDPDAGAEAELRRFARAVRDAGVRRVDGRLVLDDTAFPGPQRAPGWEWHDGEWDWYSAPVASLLLTDACLEMTVAPGPSVGAPGVVTFDPATAVVRFVNRTSTVEAGRKASVAVGRTQPDGSLPLTGTVALGGGERAEVACVDPAAHFGDVLFRILREEGVEVAGRPFVLHAPTPAGESAGTVSADAASSVVLARHATSVLDTVRVANKHSQNLYAEILLRAVGRARGDATWEGGCRAVREALGFAPDDTSFVQVDGSGLSRENQVTVGALGRVLTTMYASPSARDFIASLPAAGEEDGTLRRRLRAPRYEGRVFAKTGTLKDTSSLAGYVRGLTGRTYAFAVLCEGDVSRSRDLQDAVVDALVSQ